MTSISIILENRLIENEISHLKNKLENDRLSSIDKILNFIKQIEEKNGLEEFRIKNSNPINNGATGAIFDSIDKGYIVKVSTNLDGAEVAKSLQHENNPHVAQVKGVRELDTPNGRLVFLQIEKLKPFDEKNQMFFQSLLEPFIEELSSEAKKLHCRHQKRLSKKFRNQILKFYKENKIRLSPQEKRICRNLLRFMKQIHHNGFHFEERAPHHFMMGKRGKLKLSNFDAIKRSM